MAGGSRLLYTIRQPYYLPTLLSTNPTFRRPYHPPILLGKDSMSTSALSLSLWPPLHVVQFCLSP